MVAHSSCPCHVRRDSLFSTPIYVPNSKSEKERKIAEIDAEVLRTEDAIVTLVRQRASLKRRRNAFSPAVNLPSELLSLIFEFACLPSSTGSDGLGDGQDTHGVGSTTDGPGHTTVTPLLLGMVCTSWRHISRGTTQLWSSITVRIRHRHADTQAALLQCWLARAGSRPLDIKLVEDDANEDEEDEWGIDRPSTAVIRVLSQYAAQWHTVDMFLPVSWKPALAVVARSLPMLTRLTLRNAETSPSIAHVNIFAGAPALREVTLVGYSVSDVDLPWAQLTHLTAECFSAFEALETLRLCPNLRSCQLEQLYRGTVPFQPQPFTHPALETFELVVDTPIGLGALLDSLALPRLRALVVALPDDTEECMMKWVLPLLHRSACRLQRLHLVGVTPSEDALVECLRTVPTLTTLLLLNPRVETGGKLTGRLLHLLNPPRAEMAAAQGADGDAMDIGDEGPLAPNLERLVYQGAVAFDSHTLVKFLLNRWHGDPPLTTPAGLALPAPLTSAPGRVVPLSLGQASGGRFPRTAQLRSAIFTTAVGIQFAPTDWRDLHALQRAGMHLQFLVDPSAGM